MLQTIKFDGVSHTFPGDFTQSDIRSALAKYGQSPAAAESSGFARGAAAVRGGGPPVPGESDWRAQALRTLPTLGGVTGGILGGTAGAAAGGIGAVPGGLAGAGLGGASGRILENAGRSMMGMQPTESKLLGVIPTPPGANVPVEAINQGAQELAGLGMGGAVSRLAGTLSGKTLARASAEAENLARGSKLKIDRAALLHGIRALETEAHMMGSREVKALQKLRDSFMEGPADLSAKALHDLRQTADAVAQRIFDKRATGQVVGPGLALKGRFWEGIANKARGILKEGVPGYKQAMRRVQGAIGTREMAQQGARAVAGGALGAAGGSLMGPAGAAIGATGGAGLGATLGRAAINPQMLKGLGNVLDNPALLNTLRQTPRGLSLLAQLAGAPADVTGGQP